MLNCSQIPTPLSHPKRHNHRSPLLLLMREGILFSSCIDRVAHDFLNFFINGHVQPVHCPQGNPPTRVLEPLGKGDTVILVLVAPVLCTPHLAELPSPVITPIGIAMM